MTKIQQLLEFQATSLGQLMPTRPSFHRWLLDQGEEFTDLHPEGSVAEMRPQKECYSNSFTALADGTLDPDEWTYCEGVVLRSSLPILIEHAWLVDKDRRVLDLTLRRQDGGLSYYGVPYGFNWLYEYIVDWGWYGIHMNGEMYNPDLFSGVLNEGRAWPKTEAKEAA